MSQTIAQKLRIKERDTLLLWHAPVDFEAKLAGLPQHVNCIKSGKRFNQVHWFVMNRGQLEKEISKALNMLKENVIVWVYYPKSSSGLQTDLTRDKGWDCLMAEKKNLTWLTLISFDQTWSVFGFRPKTEADRKKEAQPKDREILKWIDPKTKTIRLPHDLTAALGKNKTLATAFESLAFSHKKEYVEWIVSAKKEETRARRIAGTIERLHKGWKNPRNI